MLIRDVMVDCETASIRENAALLSIGAVKFNPYGPIGHERDTFYRVIGDLNSQESDYGRHIDPDTLEWWAKQVPEAQREVFDNPAAIALPQALREFHAWVNRDPNMPADRIWSYGAVSDIAWLQSACLATDVPFPFTFREQACFRTLAVIAGVPRPAFAAGQVRHNALDDAINQALWAQQCFAKLKQYEALDIPV